MQLTDAAAVKKLLARHGFTFSKALGQNFLINPSVCPRMADACGADFATGVLEIGPGIGVLTKELAKRAGKVAAIELDQRLIPVLNETLAEFDNISILSGDAMKLDLKELIAREFGDMPVVVCANLPYYITSPLIMRLLEQRLPLQSITVMVQKEAADRLCARVGSRESGAVTVAVHFYAEPKRLFIVSPGSFLPPPRVDSAVLRMDLLEHPPVDADPKALFRIVRAGFAQRRKTLCNALSSSLPCTKEEAQAAMAACELPPTVRAEELSLEAFANLTKALTQSSETMQSSLLKNP